MAEQFEKVPTILYFLKQKVDIPVPRRGGVGRLRGLRPGQSPTAVAENVSTPVPRRGGPRGGLQGFPQDQAPQRLFLFLSKTLVDGFFALFTTQ